MTRVTGLMAFLLGNSNRYVWLYGYIRVHLVYGNSFSGNNHFVFTLVLDVYHFVFTLVLDVLQEVLLLDNGLKLSNFTANPCSKL